MLSEAPQMAIEWVVLIGKLPVFPAEFFTLSS